MMGIIQEWVNVNIFQNYSLNEFLSDYILWITGLSSLISLIIVFYPLQIGRIKKNKTFFFILVILSIILFIYNLFTQTFTSPSIEGLSDMIYFGKSSGNLPDGKGRLYDKNKFIVYIGNFKQGKYHNDGTLYGTYNENLEKKSYKVYSGSWKDGKFNGYGIYNSLYNGKPYLRYEGEYLLGKKNGFGTLYYYELNSKGTEVYCTAVYKGAFAYDNKFGYGIQINYDEYGNITRRYRGTWLNNKYYGVGILETTDSSENNYGKIIYHGQFVNGNEAVEGVWYKVGNKNKPIIQGEIDEKGNFNKIDMMEKYPYPDSDESIWG